MALGSEIDVQRGRLARRTKPRSFLKSAWVIFREWPVLPGLVMATLVIAAVFAPLIAPTDARTQSLADKNHKPVWLSNPVPTERDIAKGRDPSGLYRLGADAVGRDILTRVIFGARVSLEMVAIALLSGVLIGTGLGLAAGYWGGWIDELISRIVDFWLALPFIMVAMVVAIVWGQSFTIILILLALLAWSPFVRNVRAEVLTLKQRDYVNMARVYGASDWRILTRHLLPGVTNTVVVIATLRVGSLILAEASLSFLGIGIPPPTPAWGLMVAEGRQWLTTAWWISFFPGLAIFLIVMSLNFFGDWLRDKLDPRLRQI
ncbi:MAG: ABC transporter permease [Chloroflexi bacterium]|nr:ABC transporter permease [Chloroflexota bacterium]